MAKHSTQAGRAIQPAHPATVRAFQRRLIAWYHHHGRDLPWRRTRDPYAILVSEVMLQQTQVSRAVLYYERFLERYPTVEELAHADEGEVRETWEGLGYYNRARNLHRVENLNWVSKHTNLTALLALVITLLRFGFVPSDA
jgi:A/G-specific adenine glycosylase